MGTRGATDAAKREKPIAAAAAGLPYELSERERSVLALVVEGRTDQQIAASLRISRYTVNKHVGAILGKMRAPSRTAAAVRALRDRLFSCIGPLSWLHWIA